VDNLKNKLCNDVSRLFKKEIPLVLENTDKSLFSKPFYLTSEELLYLYFYIKKNYKGILSEDKIEKGFFQSIDNIYLLLSS
jgi:hypothetical protein